MKKILIFLLLLHGAQILSAQKGFGDCIRKSVLLPDSTINDSFFFFINKWKDCVLEKPISDIRFKTIAGKSYDAKQFKGKVIVLNFWFIECHPCIAELPALNRLVKEYKDKEVLFFGITYQPLSSLKRDFFPEYNFDFEIVCDALHITDQFANGFPTTYVIDKNGIVKAAWNGGSIGEQAETEIYLKAKPVIDELLIK